IDELDQSHLGPVALSVTNLQYARVPARSLREARTDGVEEPKQHIPIMDLPRRHTSGVKIAPLGEGNQPLRKRPKLFGFCRRRLNPAMAEQADRHVAEECLSMASRPAELSAFFPMSHESYAPEVRL